MNKLKLERSLSFPEAEKEKLRGIHLKFDDHGSDISKMHIKPGEINIMKYLRNMDKQLAQISNEVMEVKKICSQSKNYKTSRSDRKHMSLKRLKKNMSLKRRKKNVKKRTSTKRVSCQCCELRTAQTMENIYINFLKENHVQIHVLGTLVLFITMLFKSHNRPQNKERKSTQNFHSFRPVMKDEMSERILEKVVSAAKSEKLLDSFMYRDYFNGVNEKTNVALHPLIATSRNLDEFVAKELSSGTRQSTNHRSEEASRSRSNESLSVSEGPHSMNLELVRLETFKNFPPSRSVSTIKLAKEGFYYIGEGEDDLVICFACKSEKRGWRDGDVPREIHQQMSPQCPLLNELSVNVPVGGSLSSHNGNHRHPNTEQVYESSQRARPQNLSDPQTTEIGRHSEETGAESTVEQGSGNVSGSPTLDNDHLVPASNRNTERSETLSSQNNQSTESQLNPNHKKSRAIQEQINAFLRNLDPLGINFDRAKYPAYAVLATRVSSFQDWPTSLTQTPQVLALAGFFYAGNGDYTRCFFCGGVLRNWEPEDDPWTEHARWFPKCAFVRQNKGDEFVALAQIGHQELEALETMGEGATAALSVEQNNIIERNGGLSSGLRQSDISTFSSFQSVLKMGYSESEIKEAFNLLRGTKDPEDITRMELMEVINKNSIRNRRIKIQSYSKFDIDHAKYKSFMTIKTREKSFHSTSAGECITVLAPKLAIAGFFYMGVMDCTRCFFCGLQLLRWETRDDPWREHARWFPKCAFLRQNKGDEFVDLVQTEHLELHQEAMGAPNEHQAGDQASGPENVTSERSIEPDVSCLPAFQSVLEMGYPSHVIKQAFDLLQNTKGCTCKDITSQEVIDVILLENDVLENQAEETSEMATDTTTTSLDTDNNSSLMEENRQLKNLRLCKICMEEDASIAMLPCGHLCCCTVCAPKMRKCPICRQFVKDRLKIWIN